MNPLYEHLITAAIFLALGYWALLVTNRRTTLAEKECEHAYDLLKGEIQRCFRTEQLDRLDAEIDQFYEDYLKRVKVEILDNYVTKLLQQLTQQRCYLVKQDKFSTV